MTRLDHRASVFELRPRYSTLSNDRQKCADREFAVIRNRDCDAPRVGLPLHNDVTCTPAHLGEAVLLENPTDLASRQDAKPTHASLRSSSQRLRCEADA